MLPRLPLAAVVVLALAGSARADLDPKLQEAVRRSLKGGQGYLRQVVLAGGPMPITAGGGVGCGPACLVGLALIESGLPADDKVLVHLARSARQVALGCYHTYELSLLIMFLDRYGAKEDQPFIQFLTLRLMAGQGADGSWSYEAPALRLDPVQERALYTEFTRGARIATPDADRGKEPGKKEPRPRTDIPLDPPAAKKAAPAPPPPPKVEEKPPADGLHPAVKPFEKYARGPDGRTAPAQFGGDHSNTQFATVALWCGRRHHVDVSDTLARLDRHYRQCQSADGGWAYSVAETGSSPAMTCAGLMGLAMGFGARIRTDPAGPGKPTDDEIANDRAVTRGLEHLGDYLRAAAAERPPAGRRFAPNELSTNLYFMWSLERVGMVYGLTTIGKVDWYDWGAQLLVESQNQHDGSWPGEGFVASNPEIATAFALLFLSRANLAEDLATSMKGKVKDPGQASLKSPGDLRSMLEKGSKGSTPKGSAGTAGPKAGPAGLPKDMAAALVAARGAERDELVRKYRDSKGVEYLDALVLAAGQLGADDQAQVREALVQRLTRMTAGTINSMMTDKDRELRRAAALAAAAKGKDRLAEFADGLIERTADADAGVAAAARAALKDLTGKDFGPDDGAPAADRARARDVWKAWWQTRK